MIHQRLISGAVCLAVSGSVWAGAEQDSNGELELLRAQVQELKQAQSELQGLRAEVDRLRAKSDDDWMNERRAEEVKTLIREVLSDADTRASLLDDGLAAGHNGKKFFLASADGDFLMNIGGQMQFRHILNSRENTDDDDDDLMSGFQLRRTKLKFGGHVTANPKIKYKIVIAADRGGGEVELEDFVITVPIGEGQTLSIGQMKLPFLLEELLSSSKQLGVDRSSTTEYFTLDRGQGIMLTLQGDNTKARLMLSDGADSEGEDFNEDDTDIAFTGRIDIKLAGNWKQAKDLVAWIGEEMGVFVGGAFHYELGETGTDDDNNNILLWTADGLIEVDGMTLMLAVNGLHTDNESGDDYDDMGFLAQIATMLTEDIQPYLRYELIDMDDFDTINIITAGCNFFIKKHSAKFTIDVVHGLDPMRTPDDGRHINSPFSDGLGLATDADGEDGQTAVRTQFQLLF